MNGNNVIGIVLYCLTFTFTLFDCLIFVLMFIVFMCYSGVCLVKGIL